MMHSEGQGSLTVYCSSYCDVNNRYVAGKYYTTTSNRTLYCCGTPTHKYCCYDKALDIGDLPGVDNCDGSFSMRISNLLPWVPVMLVVLMAYPIIKSCRQKCLDRANVQSAPDAEAQDDSQETGDSSQFTTDNIVTSGLPPSYEEVTAKPPTYEEVCGMVNMGFTMEDQQYSFSNVPPIQMPDNNGTESLPEYRETQEHTSIQQTSDTTEQQPNDHSNESHDISRDSTSVTISNELNDSSTNSTSHANNIMEQDRLVRQSSPSDIVPVSST